MRVVHFIFYVWFLVTLADGAATALAAWGAWRQRRRAELMRRFAWALAAIAAEAFLGTVAISFNGQSGVQPEYIFVRLVGRSLKTAGSCYLAMALLGLVRVPGVRRGPQQPRGRE